MKVNIEIAGLPLYKAFGKSKKVEFEFHGETLKELMDAPDADILERWRYTHL